MLINKLNNGACLFAALFFAQKFKQLAVSFFYNLPFTFKRLENIFQINTKAYPIQLPQIHCGYEYFPYSQPALQTI